MPQPVTFTVELRPPPGDDKPHLRLKRALKCLLRAFGLRCVSVSEKPAKAAAGEPGANKSTPDAPAASVGVAKG